MDPCLYKWHCGKLTKHLDRAGWGWGEKQDQWHITVTRQKVGAHGPCSFYMQNTIWGVHPSVNWLHCTLVDSPLWRECSDAKNMPLEYCLSCHIVIYDLLLIIKMMKNPVEDGKISMAHSGWSWPVTLHLPYYTFSTFTNSLWGWALRPLNTMAVSPKML